MTPPQQAFSILEKNLSLKKGDYFKRTIKRAGNQTIELEGFASINGTLEAFYHIAQDVPSYRKWVLPGLNQKPQGGNYLLQILDLKASPSNPRLLTAVFGLSFPGIKQTLHKTFLITPEKNSNHVTVSCQNMESKDLLLNSLVGFISAFPDPKNKERLWVYFKGLAQLRSWILYQALPEKLLVRESSERIQTVLDNFSSEEVQHEPRMDRSDRVKSPKKKG